MSGIIIIIIIIITSCPSEIPVVDCSLWSSAVVARWQSGFTGPGEICRLPHCELILRLSYVFGGFWHLSSTVTLTFFNLQKRGSVICENVHKKKKSPHLSLHLLRKTPLLSGYSVLQGPLPARGMRRCQTLQLHPNTIWTTNPRVLLWSKGNFYLFIFSSKTISRCHAYQTLCFFFP